MSRQSVLVWDLPTRVFHWLLALCFIGAYALAEQDDWRLVHATLGFTFGALILFRAVWGLVGSRHARFSSFHYGPSAVWSYLRGLARGEPQHYTGHNPAGSWAIYALLALGLGTALSGYAHLHELGGEFVGELHEVLGNATLALAVIHVLGVIVSSALHRENLARGMITGHKLGEPGEAIERPHPLLGAALLAAVLAFWVNALGIRDAVLGSAQQFAERAAEKSEHH
ncbi:cytochrome b/b6 domain-containing protein [Fontimonas sp. SYSU GA230001]|uniref:cytochrome b/b6 domain-containing protein n=1 Tax=Fontimonas sp. SYSU GA230001 TaxID=3142450 RepID=UPI0032B33B5A